MRELWQMWSGGIPEETVDKIISIGEKFPTQDGTTFSSPEQVSKARVSTVRWVDDNNIRNILWEYIKTANLNAFGIDVYNRAELQYTEYYGTNKGHYDWHHDCDWYNPYMHDRKLSITVQLSHESEYEGGNFEFDECENPNLEDSKKKGTVLIFPSYLRHRVLPVTKGTRKSLVAWFHGPRWR